MNLSVADKYRNSDMWLATPSPAATTPAAFTVEDEAEASEPSPALAPVTCDEVTLYTPLEQESGFERLRKTVCGKEPGQEAVGADAAGNPLYYVVSRTQGDSMIKCLDHEGQTRFMYAIGRGQFEDLTLVPSCGRLFASTGLGIVSLDSATGELKGSLEYNSFGGGRRMAVSGARVAALQGKEVVLLDKDLHPQETLTLDFHASQMDALPDGSLAFSGDRNGTGYAQVLTDKRHKIIESSTVVPGSATTDERGNFWCIESEEIGHFPEPGSWSATVVKYDASTGQVTRFRAPATTEQIIPLRNGSYLLCENRSPRRWLTLCSSDGAPVHRWKYQKHGYEQCVVVDRDERFAYVVLEASSARTSEYDERHLYRVPLDADAAKKSKMKLQPLYVQKEPDRLFVPTALEDGKVLIANKQGFTVMDEHGQPVQQWRDAREAATQVRVASREVFPGKDKITSTSEDEKPIRQEVERLDKGLWPFLTSNAAYSPYDGTLNFRHVLAEGDALREMGFANRQNFQICCQAAHLDQALATDLAVKGKREQEFPGASDARLTVTPRRSDVWLPESPARDWRRTVFDVPGNRLVVSAAPFRSRDSYYAALGTNDGLLYWYDGSHAGEASRPLSFDLEAPIYHIGRMDDTAVRALAANGKTLIIRPGLAPGATLSGGMREPEMDGIARAPEVTLSDDYVMIGSVRVQRRH